MPSDTIQFVKALVRRPSAVGAIAPSSPVLARAMLRGLQWPDDRSVVEFGPGTGPFTAALHSALPDPALYLGIEIEAHFVAMLRQRFPDMRFVNGSASDAHSLHTEAALPPVAAVISGLPFASLPNAVQDGVIKALEALLPVGSKAVFRTFQYVHAYPLPSAVRFRRRMTQIFGPGQRSAMVLRNLPPAFVLSWSR